MEELRDCCTDTSENTVERVVTAVTQAVRKLRLESADGVSSSAWLPTVSIQGGRRPDSSWRQFSVTRAPEGFSSHRRAIRHLWWRPLVLDSLRPAEIVAVDAQLADGSPSRTSTLDDQWRLLDGAEGGSGVLGAVEAVRRSEPRP